MKHLDAQFGLILPSTCLGLGLMYVSTLKGRRDAHLVFGLEMCKHYYYYSYHH
jgi:hypothetical protein